MKRALLLTALWVCVLAGFGVVNAAYPVPEQPSTFNLQPSTHTDPHFYGGKISALKRPFEQNAPTSQPSTFNLQPSTTTDLPTFGADVNISGGNEVAIAANPMNPLNFVAGANNTGRFTTTDGGVTWNVGSLSGGGDPATVFDAAGNAYFALLGNTLSCPDLPLVYKSTNGGLNWGASVFPFSEPNPTVNFYDKEWINVDNYASSPFFGRIYYTASVFRTPPGCNLNNYIDVALKLTYSTDQGVTWSASSIINDASHNQNQFTNPVPAPDGALYVGYQYQNCTFNCTRDIPMANLIAKSTDGGVSFSPSITMTGQVISPTGAFSGGYQFLLASSASSGFRHNDQAIIGVSPTNSNIVYAVWTDGRWDTDFTYQGITGRHADVASTRSTDGGLTWAAPVRVNDDPIGNGKDQFFPWMTVGSDGTLHASWMDRRDAGAGFQYREYYSQSTDGGLTWAANIPASDVGGSPSTFIGDYSSIAVNSDNTLVLPLWTDSRAGNRVYTDRGVMLAGTATPTFTPCAGCATSTITPTRTPTQCVAGYVCTVVPGATIVPGTTDTGNHGDDVATQISLPFPVSFYGVTYNTANVISNGNLQFVSNNTAFTNTCLPATIMGPTIFAFWEDLRTDTTGTCTGGCGIYTSVSGAAPNRIFNIEWRTYYFTGTGNAYFEIRLSEAASNLDIIIGQLTDDTSATIGVQDGAGRFTQCSCNTPPIPSNSHIIFLLQGCGTPTTLPTICPTPSRTPVITHCPTTAPTRTFTPVLTATPEFTTCPTTEPTFTFTPVTSVTPTCPPVTATPCTMSFSDVNPNDYFYQAIYSLSCRGIVSGYADRTFRPYNNTTRGQLAKIIALAVGWIIECPSQPHFTDVPPGSPFYCYVETAYAHGVISGYTDGTFRPGNNVTRGQLCKIISLAMPWTLVCPSQPHFLDVLPDHPFYCYIETAYQHNVIAGYADGTFRPGSNATRGQICVIIYRAIGPPSCGPLGVSRK